MKFKWTMKELKTASDNKMIRAIIAERMSGLNIYAPLHLRLQALYNKYDELVKKEDSNE